MDHPVSDLSPMIETDLGPLLPRGLLLTRNALEKGDCGLADLLEEAEHVILEPHQALHRELRVQATADVWH